MSLSAVFCPITLGFAHELQVLHGAIFRLKILLKNRVISGNFEPFAFMNEASDKSSISDSFRLSLESLLAWRNRGVSRGIESKSLLLALFPALSTF